MAGGGVDEEREGELRDLRERQVKERRVTMARVRREPWRVQMAVVGGVCVGFAADIVGAGGVCRWFLSPFFVFFFKWDGGILIVKYFFHGGLR